MDVDAVFSTLGRFSIWTRWLMTLAWIAAAVLATLYLPSLSSVTQNDNTKFLPASAPVERAAALAAPFGTANLLPVPLVAARAGAPLTPADTSALAAIRRSLLADPAVRRVLELGESAAGQAGQAAQYLVLTRQLGGDPNAASGLIDGLRARIAATPRPPGLRVHLAGAVAVSVDQQKANGNQGAQIERYSALLIIVLLVFIFRSLTLAIVTLVPALLSVLIAGPLVAEASRHGLSVSPIAQFLMIVLVLGAGTDYGLFLVFRVREELRAGGYDGGPATGRRAVLGDLRRPREPARKAIVTSLTKVGESVTFSAATVIAAVLTLLLASFPFYADLGVPFAIAVGVTLLAALTLLPALLSIRLSLLGVKRTLFQRMFGRPKLLPWDIQGAGKGGLWGAIAGRIVRHPVPTLLAGLVFFGGLSLGVAGYKAAGFGGDTTPPANSDSAAGQALLTRYFPQSAANPTNLIFRFRAPVWDHPGALATATSELRASALFTQVTGPLNPVGGQPIPAYGYAKLHAALGSAKSLPLTPPNGSKVPAPYYQLYRATGNYVSADGRTVQFSTGLAAGDPSSTAAMNAVPAIRAETSRVAAAAGATSSGVAGQAPALYDISHISSGDLKKIVPIAIAVIGLLLAVVLRSLVAPTYLIASVAVSYLAALGLAALVFITLGHSDGLVFFLPFLMFIFLLALGEDYNILVMTRIREEAHKLPLRQAVSRALAVTGTTVTSAGLVLAGSFLVLAFVAGGGSGASQIRDIGFALALGILMDTFLVRTLLVPSTVVLLGRWNWWPSRLTVDQPGPPADSSGDASSGQPGTLAPEGHHAG